jgi:hypothetical protein
VPRNRRVTAGPPKGGSEGPDDIGTRLAATGDLSRQVLESFALRELKMGRISEPKLCRILGLARIQLDGFRNAHGVYEDDTMEDFEKERAVLKRLGL